MPNISKNKKYILAFDTANEIVAIGVGVLRGSTQEGGPHIQSIGSVEVMAKRASNTKLLPLIDSFLRESDISKKDIACVACGRGPGSFTGVRIAMATAKGIASALEVPLVGFSTTDAVAFGVSCAGYSGKLGVLPDAMRGEVYPVCYELHSGSAPIRQNADAAVKVHAAAPELSADWICGDSLHKYASDFKGCGEILPENLWTPTGEGAIRLLEHMWRSGQIDPYDYQHHNPAILLPVYTRLSDAEENERIKLAKQNHAQALDRIIASKEVALKAGCELAGEKSGVAGSNSAAHVRLVPMGSAHLSEVEKIEQEVLGTDVWNKSQFASEIPMKDRCWWVALSDGVVVGYAGGMIAADKLDILKVAVLPKWRRAKVATLLLDKLAKDARDLGAVCAILEVRASNVSAQMAYSSLGFSQTGTRRAYYSDNEDALIFEGPLPIIREGIAGMDVQVRSHDSVEVACAATASGDETTAPSALNSTLNPAKKPLILAIETSCDETAAAVIDGNEVLLSDVVASQIDFHARFGGVVPEIASRKHIEAICGVCDEALSQAGRSRAMGSGNAAASTKKLRWRDLDAVAVTFAPGLVGALVVGVAFAKGAAWACDLPLIGVNHMEGHIYASKLAHADLQPPMVVSLVSGGHTMLVHAKDWGDYEVMGETLDDAVGEAFDKVAKAMGLGYPGGPIISKLAKSGNPQAIAFPRAMMHSGDLRFSLSGLKTAVITYMQKEEESGMGYSAEDVAASFQQAVIDVQIHKAKKALRETGAKEFCLGGGVAANPELREAYQKMCRNHRVRLSLPPMFACSDNAGMIALVACDRFRQQKFLPLNADAHAHLNLEEDY